jgi:hypothetical protein
VKHRPVAVLAAAAVAATVLAGCDTKVGAAATVGGKTIPESQVNQYLTAKARPIPTQGGTVVPRSYALEALVLQELLLRSLAAHGGTPSAATIKATEVQLRQGQSPTAVRAGYTRYGFAPKMAEFDYRVHALEQLLGNRTKAANIQALAKVVNAQHIPVSISRRYGKWQPSTLSIATSNGAGLPNMVKLQPTPALQP